jgi:hypothetical protein
VTPYEKWIREEAVKIHSDGCTGVRDWNLDCCFEHDLGYFYGKDPQDAYQCYLSGIKNPWLVAAKSSRSSIDARFRACNQGKSKIGKLSPLSVIRWVGVRLFGGPLWSDRRENETKF